MSKRNYTLNIKKINKRIKEGRGFGIGEEYKPFITVYDVPSSGRSTRIRGWITNRTQHFLSDLERNLFLKYQFREDVVDIREQFPLFPLEETIKIAEELNIKHPRDPKSKELIIPTTDLLVTLKGKDSCYNIAIAAKYKQDLKNQRTIEKLKIEKIYWERRNVHWMIKTEEDIDKVYIENIRNIYPYFWLMPHGNFTENNVEMFYKYIKENYANFVEQKFTLYDVTSDFDKKMEFEYGTGLLLAKYYIAHHIMKFDMYKKFLPYKIELKDITIL